MTDQVALCSLPPIFSLRSLKKCKYVTWFYQTYIYFLVFLVLLSLTVRVSFQNALKHAQNRTKLCIKSPKIVCCWSSAPDPAGGACLVFYRKTWDHEPKKVKNYWIGWRALLWTVHFPHCFTECYNSSRYPLNCNRYIAVQWSVAVSAFTFPQNG